MRFRLREEATRVGASRVFCMHVGFVHDVIDASQHELLDARDHVEIHGASCAADGVLIDKPGDAVFFANADCPVGVLYDPAASRAVVMHLGFGCLWKESLAPPFLIERAVDRLGAPPATLLFFAGGGIGPCCYGVRCETPSERARQAYIDALLPHSPRPTSLHGPRSGQPSLDLMAIIEAQALGAGVGHIRLDPRCTSCAGMEDPDAPGFGAFFSNARDTERGLERNMTLVTLRPRRLWMNGSRD